MRWTIVLLAMSACYRPSDSAACRATCASASDCPDDLECNVAARLCQFAGSDPCGTQNDAPADAIDFDSLTRVCAGSPGSPFGVICFDPMPSFTTLKPSIDTDTDPDCVTSSPPIDACILVNDTANLDITFTGSRPAILWSSTSITINGTLDVSSSGLRVGASGAFSSCVNAAGSFDTGNNLGSGGAGGSFGGVGGLGGELDLATLTPGGSPSKFIAALPHGGCSGGSGGHLGNTNNGGFGGGVIGLTTATSITVNGKINASGSGAKSADARTGGGGGGSGGEIEFDAPSIVINDGAIVLALGGSGGSGGAAVLAGTPGNDPKLSPGFSANGVSGPSGCVNQTGGGGSLGGGLQADPGGDTPLSTTCGAGGGGGGDGRIGMHPAAASVPISAHVLPTPNLP